ncbi:MAG: LysM peptidoglycan-binding domain-containing protein [Bacteriovorax sp.]|nr:LysM peptidoglycan-binding domain-containing protein [Bacteriovorax sp.]
MKKISVLFIVSFILNACSFSNTSKETVASRPSDELEFTVDTFGEAPASEIKVEEQKITEVKIPDEISPVEKPIDKPLEMAAPEEPKFTDYHKEKAPEIPPLIVTESSSSSPDLGKEAEYHFQKGDTLMMVAFKIYGDYRKWKDLREWNKDKIKTKMEPGVVLKYYLPGQSFGWRPNGVPYMVKTGDTLQIVSMDKYGTTKKWKNIYENNRPLIRDPNLIFAGFTIYYVPVRDIASGHK